MESEDAPFSMIFYDLYIYIRLLEHPVANRLIGLVYSKEFSFR